MKKEKRARPNKRVVVVAQRNGILGAAGGEPRGAAQIDPVWVTSASHMHACPHRVLLLVRERQRKSTLFEK